MPLNRDIHLRDPFVLPVPADRTYLLFGTTDPDPWKAPGAGFDVYAGTDLGHWEGPRPAFRPEPGFWGTTNFWAPEAHVYRGRCYLFASFKAEGARRATQILSAGRPQGPYRVHSAGPVTPRDWECLDGTLHVDPDGLPWVVFCREWVQVRDGEVCAVRLSENLTRALGKPRLLFRASEAPWTRPVSRKGAPPDPADRVTDGPFLHRTADGTLLMLWSSFSDTGYAMGVARSATGRVEGPWRQAPRPLVEQDAGHGMIFHAFDGRLLITVHTPNRTPDERPVFLEAKEQDGTLALAGSRAAGRAGEG
jgi:arabinan endo-1,5-alpha-L-arabinosidase